MQSVNRQTVPIQQFDAKSALELSETRSTIENFFYDFCGLQTIRKGDQMITARISRPTFTYEFAKDVITRMYVEANMITARSTYSKDKIKLYLLKKCETMMEWFAVVGIHKIVSDSAWQKINDLAEIDPDSIYEDDEGKVKGENYWYTKYHIVWDYNRPVNDDMLRIVKNKYDLHTESFGQDTILRDIFWSIRQFLEAGINRSQEALTLNHEKIIHKESMITNSDDPRLRGNESFFDKIKRKFGG